MKAVLVLLFLVASFVPNRAQSTSLDQAELQVSVGNARFSNKLYKVLTQNQTGNVIFSPLSVHECLSMLYQGAKGSTLQVLATGLQVSTPKIAADGYSRIMDELNSAVNLIITVANKIYVAIQQHIKPSFRDVVVDKFQAEIQSLDFGQTEPSRQTINEWVSNKTRGKIPELLNKGDLSASTEMVLVNAVYFKASWLFPFNSGLTKREPFYLDNTRQVQTDIMHLGGKTFNYRDSNTLCAQMLQLPYSKSYSNSRDDVSMIILLPHRRDALSRVENALVNYDLTKIMTGSLRVKVNLALPKFKFDFSAKLKDALTEIGMGELFTRKANLSGLLEDGHVMVSSVIQKAFIDVNENGTEAAAATATILVGSTGVFTEEQKPINFVANHPFIFLLIQESMYSPTVEKILFYGRVENPVS